MTWCGYAVTSAGMVVVVVVVEVVVVDVVYVVVVDALITSVPYVLSAIIMKYALVL